MTRLATKALASQACKAASLGAPFFMRGQVFERTGTPYRAEADIFRADFQNSVRVTFTMWNLLMSLTAGAPRANYGLLGFFFGVGALLAAVMLTSGVFIPEPQQSVGTSIGEIARDIRAAATGVFSETVEAPVAAPEPAPFDPTMLLSIITPVLAAIAVVLGGISLFRHEPTSLPKLAIGFGVGSVVMQFVFWLALVICGTMILTAILSNMDGIFDI